MLLRRWPCAPLAGLLALPLTAAAAEPGPGPSLAGQPLQMGWGGPLAPQGGQHIRVISLYPLGPRDRLALVEVGGRQLLLGISPGRITTLHVLEEPVTDDARAGGGDFARKLQAMLKRDQKP